MNIFTVILFFGWGIAQIIAGVQGINFHFGSLWAFFSIVSLFFGFSLPITIASFFGALNVWKWHWFFSLLLAFPGLLFIIPGTFVVFYKSLKNKLQNNFDYEEKTTQSQNTSSNLGKIFAIISIFSVIICVIISNGEIKHNTSNNQDNNNSYNNNSYNNNSYNNNSYNNNSYNNNSYNNSDNTQSNEEKVKPKDVQKLIPFETKIINGILYNKIVTPYDTFYMTPPFLDSLGYSIKVIFPTANKYGVVAISKTSCSVYNKRIKGESSLNPQLYLDGELSYIFGDENEGSFSPVANYICNYYQ